jgi:hypothetical protein
VLPKRCTRKIARSILKQLATRPRAIAKTATYVISKRRSRCCLHISSVSKGLTDCVCGSERGEGREARVGAGLRLPAPEIDVGIPAFLVIGGILFSGARSDSRSPPVRATNPSQTATLEMEICGQRLSTANAANAPRRRPKRLSRPTDAAQAAGMSCYSAAEEITPVCADFLVADAVQRNWSAAAEFPVNREKNREYFDFRPFRSKSTEKTRVLSGCYEEIP